MAKKVKIIWIECLYLGLFSSIFLHILFWSGRIIRYFERPPYRLRWEWDMADPFLFSLALILIIFISVRVLLNLRYLKMPSLLKNVLYLLLSPSTLLIFFFLPIPILTNTSILRTSRIHPEFASPSGQFMVQTIGTSDTCYYRIYANHSMIQKYVGEFRAHNYDCGTNERFQWSRDEKYVEVFFDDHPTIKFNLPR